MLISVADGQKLLPAEARKIILILFLSFLIGLEREEQGDC